MMGLLETILDVAILIAIVFFVITFIETARNNEDYWWRTAKIIAEAFFVLIELGISIMRYLNSNNSYVANIMIMFVWIIVIIIEFLNFRRR